MLKRIRSYLMMGLIVLLPTIFTLYILDFLFKVIDPILGRFISNILVMLYIIPQFPINIPNTGITLTDRIPGIGLLVTIIILIFVGMTTKSLIGKHILRFTEKFFSRIPIARSIYSTVQQIVNAFTQDKTSFKKVVLAQYPKDGLYTMGFLTGENTGELKERFSEKLVNVFFPTTPNPTSGWLALVPIEDIIVLDMTVEEGLKFIISGGVVAPKDNNKQYEGKIVLKYRSKNQEIEKLVQTGAEIENKVSEVVK